MKFDKKGNLGKVDLLHHLLTSKQMTSEGGTVTLTDEEMDEVVEQLSQFRYALSNLFLNKDSLENDQYRGLSMVIKELEPYYRNYNGGDSNEGSSSND